MYARNLSFSTHRSSGCANNIAEWRCKSWTWATAICTFFWDKFSMIWGTPIFLIHLSECFWVVRRSSIGKPNQNIAVLRGLALPTRNILASTKLRDCSEGTSKATCAFVLATLHPVGRASPLKTAIFAVTSYSTIFFLKWWFNLKLCLYSVIFYDWILNYF